METLGRWAAYLAIAGGALFTVILVITAVWPTSPALYGFFVAIVLLGVAVAGLYWRTRPATGRLGWLSAWLSGLGTVALVLVAIVGAVTGEISTMLLANPPMTPFVISGFAASLAWLIGNLGFAVALIRARTSSKLGAWLVLAGALVAVATTPLYEMNDPTLTLVSSLLFGLMPVGWVVVGYSALRRAGA